MTVAMVLAEASERHGAGLHQVLLRCSYLLDETAVHGGDTVVRHGQVLDVLPPFAGGADGALGQRTECGTTAFLHRLRAVPDENGHWSL
jgi:hypothetical protein